MSLHLILIILTHILFLGCSNQKINKTIFDPIEKNTEKKMDFNSKEEAESYFFDRRLQLQRLYEITSEPYFGTPKQVDCAKSIDFKGVIKNFKTGRYFSMKLLANDYLALGDCLTENNSLIALYEFKLCKKSVYETRSYFRMNVEVIPKLELTCP